MPFIIIVVIIALLLLAKLFFSIPYSKDDHNANKDDKSDWVDDMIELDMLDFFDDDD